MEILDYADLIPPSVAEQRPDLMGRLSCRRAHCCTSLTLAHVPSVPFR